MFDLSTLSPDQKELLSLRVTPLVTEHKKKLMRQVLENRTRHLAVVLEDIYQPHNASAVLRSVEALGLQDVYTIEKHNSYKPNKDIVMGAHQWVDLHSYPKTMDDPIQSCVCDLKSQGYQLAAFTLKPESIDISDLDISKKTALCFGTEEDGLSQEMHDHCDVFVKIPMVGFTQSFNISVSAAISIFYLTEKLKRQDDTWALSDEDKEKLYLQWLVTAVPHGDAHIKAVMKNEL